MADDNDGLAALPLSQQTAEGNGRADRKHFQQFLNRRGQQAPIGEVRWDLWMASARTLKGAEYADPFQNALAWAVGNEEDYIERLVAGLNRWWAANVEVLRDGAVYGLTVATQAEFRVFCGLDVGTGQPTDASILTLGTCSNRKGADLGSRLCRMGLP